MVRVYRSGPTDRAPSVAGEAGGASADETDSHPCAGAARCDSVRSRTTRRDGWVATVQESSPLPRSRS